MGADPNVKDLGSRSPLHDALDADTMKVLLENGADVNAMDEDKTTPLHEACISGDIEITKVLLEKGANIEALEKDVVELSFEKAPQLVNKIVKTYTGDYPIHIVSQQGNEELLEWLLKKGAIVSVKNKNGHTPIHSAIEKGHLNIVKFLLQRTRSDRKSTFESNLLLFAVKHEQFEVVKELLDRGTYVDVQESGRATSLNMACQLGYERIVKLLLEYNASPNIQDTSGATPLHWAVNNKRTNIVQMLTESDRCLFNIKNQNGKTPLDLAFEGNQFGIAKVISNKMSYLLDTNRKLNPIQNENASKCVICYEDKDGTYAFLPCGHACACKKCCEIIKRDQNKDCPICRGNVVQYQKIFISHH